MSNLRNLIGSLFLGSLIFIVSGCSVAQVVHTNQADQFTLSDYKTYNYYEVEIDTIDLPEFTERIRWIEHELRSQFEEKGVIRSKENPELLVNIGLVFVEKTQTRETDLRSEGPMYGGGLNYGWEIDQVAVADYQEGTMVMHLVDAKSKILMYEGIVQSVVLEKDNKSQKNIAAAVKHLFGKID